MTQFISENNLYQDNAMINFGTRPPPPPSSPKISNKMLNDLYRLFIKIKMSMSSTPSIYIYIYL